MRITKTILSVLSDLRKTFSDASAPTIIPSPFDVAISLRDDFIAHIRYVRAEQEAFNQRLNAVGIARLSKMTSREVLEMYGTPQR